MDSMVSEIVVKLSPVFLLIGTGVGVRRLKLFSPETIDGFKKLIINISLLAILHDHIKTVVSRYKGRVHTWSIIEEPELAVMDQADPNG